MTADTAKKAGTASWATRTFTRFHVLLNRLSGGRLFNSFSGVANPDITVSHRGRSEKLRARLASVEEKPELWPICDQYYAPYAEYRERTDRDIPIFVCE